MRKTKETQEVNGGQGGIRTHETLARLLVFKTSFHSDLNFDQKPLYCLGSAESSGDEPNHKTLFSYQMATHGRVVSVCLEYQGERG